MLELENRDLTYRDVGSSSSGRPATFCPGQGLPKEVLETGRNSLILSYHQPRQARHHH